MLVFLNTEQGYFCIGSTKTPDKVELCNLPFKTIKKDSFLNIHYVVVEDDETLDLLDLSQLLSDGKKELAALSIEDRRTINEIVDGSLL